MKILKVIHGYPMRYNAGSEVYSQILCQALADEHEVHVFTREEDAFAPDFNLRLEHDTDDPRITIHLVNNPRLKDRYRATGIDERFAEVLDCIQPDLVHVGHLNHLSTSLLQQATNRSIPLVYTLHDYWLMCPRGQFMQTFPEDTNSLWATCDGQQDRKCAKHCYSRYFSGAPDDIDTDMDFWTDWVARRMKHVREMADLIDLFIAPSRHLHDRYRDSFGLPEDKLVYLDYGFVRKHLQGRRRISGEPFTFGYIGTHIPAKGIHDLIHAFGKLQGDAQLRIWGRPQGQDTASLKSIAAGLPDGGAERVQWLTEYRNQDIIAEVFNRCDAIIVPSIWVENSPLVIHEAQQAGVPVITANAGGMAEYVQHEVNGLLFEHRSVDALATQMQRFLDNPKFAEQLGARGYLQSATGDIPDINEHVRDLESHYKQLLGRSRPLQPEKRTGPWRITFDTNPDTCNLRCIMCEEHSPHSQLQVIRKMEKRERRVMPFEMIETIIADSAAHGLQEIIPSTMGEPLFYQHFEGILDLCTRHNLKLNLTTNGTFPRLGAERWGEKIIPLASDVKISWNGASKKTHEAIMFGSRWDDVLANVRTFVAVRDRLSRTGADVCRITFQLTFLESNVDELADIVRLAIELDVDRVKGHHLWTHFEEIEDQSMRRDAVSIRRWNIAVQAAHAAAAEQPLRNGKYILIENIFPLEESATEDLAPGGPCPFLGQEAWISAEGRFDPCCAPDAQRRTLGDFGNLDEQKVMDIWNGDNYQRLLKDYRKHDLCRGCNMRKPAEDET